MTVYSITVIEAFKVRMGRFSEKVRLEDVQMEKLVKDNAPNASASLLNHQR
jgi:hypothetical protein